MGAHLWAVGFDGVDRAEQVREQIQQLHEQRCILLLNSSVAVRYPDGSVVLDGQPTVAPIRWGGLGLTGFLAALALGAPPLTEAAANSWAKCPEGRGIDDAFINEVERVMKPGTSVLFVLD